MNVGIFRSVNTHIQDGVVEIICKEKIEEKVYDGIRKNFMCFAKSKL